MRKGRYLLILLAVALGFTFGASSSGFAARAKKPKILVGLQLYTVRDDCAKDFPGVIARELHHTTQGEWMVLLRFKDQSSMDLFLKRLKDDPDTSFKTYGSLIEHSTMRIDFAWRRH